MTLPQPYAYFPVERTPLRMAPRLRPFGTDFGNGRGDRLFFQRDADYAAYADAKLRVSKPGTPAPCSRLRLRAEDEREQSAHEAALCFAADTLLREHPDLEPLSLAGDLEARWHRLGLALQEDLVLVQRDRLGVDRVLATQVCFPSGWRPEQILGWDFRAVHEPVPGFAEQSDTARSLASAMIDRGPYVRFIWTLCADAQLDHHPDFGARTPWGPKSTHGWLRVERQVTLPLKAPEAALFLIRTYCTAFERLHPKQRATLARAVACMPRAVRNYKQLPAEPIRRVLARSGPLA